MYSVEQFVKEKVGKNYVAVGGDADAFLDPSSLIIWLSVAKEMVALLQECKKLRNPADIVKNPNLRDRIVLRNEIRKTLGVRGFLREGRQLTDAFLKSGAELTKEEVEALCDEV